MFSFPKQDGYTAIMRLHMKPALKRASRKLEPLSRLGFPENPAAATKMTSHAHSFLLLSNKHKPIEPVFPALVCAASSTHILHQPVHFRRTAARDLMRVYWADTTSATTTTTMTQPPPPRSSGNLCLSNWIGDGECVAHIVLSVSRWLAVHY